MDDRSITIPRPFDGLPSGLSLRVEDRAGWSLVRICESSRHQRQLLAQAYQQVFPQVPQPLSNVNVAAGACGIPTGNRTAARVAAGA